VLFISGGKWTTYREMAQDLVDRALSLPGAPVADKNPKEKVTILPCNTLNIGLHGRRGFTSNLPIRLAQEFGVSKSVAQHLSQRYGGLADHVLRIARDEKGPSHLADLGQPLVAGHGYLRAEVVYAARHEWAVHAEDVIARRMRLAFLNKCDAQRAVQPIVDLMGKELNWNAARRKQEVHRCLAFLDHFGGPAPK
jgi:glycerol-3-phosphate dehydrogenase